MPIFTDEAFDEILGNFDPNDRDSRNAVLVAAEEQLQSLTRRLLRKFPSVRCVEQTDEVAQQCLIRMNTTLQKIDVKTARDFFRLAAMHIRYAILDLARKIKELPLPADDDGQAAGEIDNSTWDPAKIARWQEFHELVETLPEREREVFDALWYQGLNKAQAATVLDLSVDQVTYSWTKTRMQLIAAFDGDLPI